MAVLLETAKLLTQDMLCKGVIETLCKSSGVLERLPFVDVQGSGYTFNLHGELPSVAYRGVNEAYTESSAKATQMTEALCILGGDVDTDVYLQKTHSNFNDLRAMQTERKTKAIARKFEADFFSGTGADSKSLKGLEKRLAEKKVGTEIKDKALSLDTLNELLDSVVDGADCLFMSKTLRRSVMSLLQASNHYIESGEDSFGRPVSMYGGVQLVAVDDSLITKDKIYAVKFGTDEYVHGIKNGDISVRDLGEQETKPCYRTRIEFYAGLCVKHPKAFAIMTVKAS